MEHPPADALVAPLEEVVGDEGEPPGVVLLLVLGDVGQEAVKDVEEELEAELIEEVDLVEIVDGEVDGAAGEGERLVLLARLVDLLHDRLRLVHLPRDLGRLLLQRLQRADDRVVV